MNRAGVTLIELIVSLTITATLFAVGYSAFGTALDRREAALRSLETETRAASIRASLQGWLQGARVPPQTSRPVFSGADGFHENAQDDELVFLTSAPTPLGRGFATVRLWVDRDPDTPEIGLVAEITRWLGTDRIRMELAPEVEGLDVRYRSRVLRGREWHLNWISSSVMPQGLELSLTGSDEDPLHPLLAYPLRAAFHGGR
jgi:prepilin-type N-terminal cleavage/methylation domain-containing protein